MTEAEGVVVVPEPDEVEDATDDSVEEPGLVTASFEVEVRPADVVQVGVDDDHGMAEVTVTQLSELVPYAEVYTHEVPTRVVLLLVEGVPLVWVLRGKVEVLTLLVRVPEVPDPVVIVPDVVDDAEVVLTVIVPLELLVMDTVTEPVDVQLGTG